MTASKPPFSSTVCILVGLLLASFSAQLMSFDLFGGFEKEKVKSTIWELNEQYVRLVQIESKAAPNDHPVAIDAVEIEHAMSSLRLWVKGGILRDEESVAVYPRRQAAMIAPYLVDALAQAAPDEDVTFNVRGYTDVMLSVAKERVWTTGRVFYKDGRLNLIIGEHDKRIDKAKKQVEASFGVIDDFRDVHFQVGSRHHKGKMSGRVVTTEGVQLGGDSRPDWIVIDVARAALAWRDSQVPTAVRKEEQRAKDQAAKLTIERRQMREEMARLRKELRSLQQGGAGGGATLEQRLARLQQLHEKGLITDEDFERRKGQILSEI
ncbi:MAG: SHOCT domain-containing protein [Gammaproteobacteria bacterium]